MISLGSLSVYSQQSFINDYDCTPTGGGSKIQYCLTKTLEEAVTKTRGKTEVLGCYKSMKACLRNAK
jgi:hypothetical protein